MRSNAGGRAAAAGATYQAGVVAYIYAHVLSQARLGWFGLHDAVPVAVSAETGGPGDDARVEFDGLPHVEVQAKHALAAGDELDNVLVRIRDISPRTKTAATGLIVGRGSSRKFWEQIPDDIERLRSGRQEPVGEDVQRLRRLFDDGVVTKLHIVAADFDRAEDLEPKVAQQLLRWVLAEPRHAEAAWSALIDDATQISARGLRRTRKDLIDVLALKAIEVRPPEPDDRWHRELDLIQQLLDDREAFAAGVALKRVSDSIRDVRVGAKVHYRLHRLSATAALQGAHYREALENAQKALVVDPTGPDALRTAALAAMFLGDLRLASSLAEKAVSGETDDPKAWGTFAQVRRAAGAELVDPPARIRSDPHYLTVLSEIAGNEGDWERALDLTSQALASEPNEPDTLFLRANALLATAGGDESTIRTHAAEADAIASQLIESLHQTHPFVPKALVLRSAARQRLDREDEAIEDLARARQLDPDELEAIRIAAARHVVAGDDDAAIQILASRAVEENALLLGMRAEIHARLGQREAGLRDLSSAIQRLAGSDAEDVARLAVAEAAIELGELDSAANLLDGVVDNAADSPWPLLFRGRILLKQGNVEAADGLYRQAADLDPKQRGGILAELGVQLVAAGSTERAIEAFRDAVPSNLEAAPARAYVQALMDSSRLVEAREFVEGLAAREELPSWAVAVATNLALRQEDSALAIKHLGALIDRGETFPNTRIALAKSLLDLRRTSDALEQIEALLDDGTLQPVDRMQAAELLELAGRPIDAVREAFRAFRGAPQDPRMHRAFASIILRSKTELPTPETVEPDTFVVVRADDGRVERTFIYAEGPVDSLRGEVLVTDPAAAGLMGLRVGDRVERQPDTRWGISWRVEEILPAVVAAFRDVIDHFETRFPEADFFVAGFKVGDGGGVRDFAPLIASLGDRTKHVEAVFDVQRQQVLPLGVLASQLGGAIEDFIDAARGDPTRTPTVVAEWSDSSGQADSIRSVTVGRRLVVTRSALKTLVDLDLVEALSRFEIVAPSSLVAALERDAKEARQEVETGTKTLVPGPAGFRLEETPPGAPSLAARAQQFETEIAAIANATIAVRPLRFIGTPGSADEALRNMIGPDSYDAIALAYELDATLVADDLGLRRVVLAGRDRPSSASSISLLLALVAADALDPVRGVEALLRLQLWRYDFVPPLLEVLELAIDRTPELERRDFERAMALLASPLLEAESAARLAARLLKVHAMRPLQRLSLRQVAEACMKAMSVRWPAGVVAQLLEQQAIETFKLMPQQMDEIRRVTSRE
jgi:tetratricopeptide (TPR) repeat protein